MATSYRPRTDVERWQIQDRLRVRLRRLGCEARPRFYEGPSGQLAFRLRVGWRASPAVLRGLEQIDEVGQAAG